ncbi:MAG: UUP1 family membrane protein [Gammaproteobacteria bacterium]|nr:UUP1 family membrane protein [Gammaproteobacteria bacterium]
MTQRGPFLFFVILLFLAGIGTAAYRHDNYQIPILPGTEQTVWQVEARVEFIAQGGATQVYLTLPPEQSGFRLIGESSASSGFGFEVSTQEQQRRAHWTKRRASGEQTLFYKLDLVQDPGHHVEMPGAREAKDQTWDEPYQTAALQLLESAILVSADAHSLAQQLSSEMNQAATSQNLSLLLDRYSPEDLMASLLNTANVPARTVQVLELEDGRRRQGLRNLVQVWDNDQWQLFDPMTGEVNDEQLLLWQTASPAVLEVLGGSRSRVSFSIISQSRPAATLMDQSAPGFDLSLYNLPVAEQSMFKLIMLLPMGALMVVVMRILVGLKTSGTFMPVLIALAFLQTELIPGVTSFVVVVAIGLVIRSYLSSLNLLLVSRIATLVVVVIGIITLFSVLSYQFGLMGGLTITFFPMIILAWTIERMSIVWEEQGPQEVAIQGSGSLLVAILAFLVMDQQLIRHLAFNFPELNLCVLALILLLGRYTGYRLLELHRFAVFNR